MGNGLRKSVLAVLVGLVVVLASVCDEDKSPTSASSAPATLKYISGNNQTGLRLNRLAQPLLVQVLDYDDDPVAAHKVVFEVTSLNGTLAGSGQKKQEVVTNANGMTSVYLVLGDSLGLDSVRASTVDASNRPLNGSPILFTASVDTSGTGEDDAPDDTTQIAPSLTANSVRIMSGNYQGANGEYFEGQLLPMLLVVQVLDTALAGTQGYPHEGAPVSGFPVLFTVYGPDGATGEAAIAAEPGEGPGGTGRLRATTDIGGLAAVRLTLAEEFYVDGNFSSYLNNHRVEVVVVFSDGSQDSVLFFATGVALAPDDTTGPVIIPSAPGVTANNVRIVSGNYQGASGEYFEGQLLPMPLVVQVLDTSLADTLGYPHEGAPVSGFPVLFTVYGPEGAGVEPVISSDPGGGPGGTGLLQATTDVDGLAAVRLKLAEKFGGGTVESNQNNHRVEVVAVFSDGRQDSVIFFATAVPQTPIDTTAAVIPDADRIELISGDSQTGVPGELLGEPIVLAVYDSVGEPVTGAEVTAIIKEGGGLISFWGQDPTQAELMSLVTDSEGMVRLAWRLGPLPELDNEILAVLTKPDGSSSSVTIKATGVDPDRGPNSIALVSGDGQTGEVAVILALPLVARVFNKDGQPVPGAVVTFTVTRGFGSISLEGTLPVINEMLTVTTDEQGVAAVTLKLGPGPDLDNEVVAQIRRSDGTADSVVFSSVARPKSDTANSLVIMSGNYQGLEGNYIVKTELPLPLVVGVFDNRRTEVSQHGAPISNFPVLFEAFSPSGDAEVKAVDGTEPAGTGRLKALTDEDGLAAVRLTMGTKTGAPDDPTYLRNNNHVIAVAVFADGTQDSVMFFATAVPGAPTSLAAAGGTELSGIAGKALSGLTVVVTDGYGNSKASVPVSFVIDKSPGGGSISQPLVLTDINGYATSGLSQLSTVADKMQVSAVNGNLSPKSIPFTINVLADEADVIMAAGGDNQVGTIGTAFSGPLKVMILDQYGNPCSGVLVTFAESPPGSASLSTIVIKTDSDGMAQTTVTPMSTAVTITAGAVIHGATQTETFNLTATAEE